MFRLLLDIHIVAGTIALVVAPLAMAVVKGGVWHRRWGKLYFWMMAVVAVTSAGMCYLRSGLFLFLIAIFSFYLALTGYRALRRKAPGDRATVIDWSSALIMLVAAAALFIRALLAGNLADRWIPALFGVIGLFLAVEQIFHFLKPPADPRAWLYAHMTRFLAAYIATVSAFSVVNFTFLPPIWRWLWPAILGTFVIILWRKRYEKSSRPVPEKRTPISG